METLQEGVQPEKHRLRLEREHVERFAEASGDRNPLHLDEAVARKTPYGRCIAHGALVTIAALRLADGATLRHAASIAVQFKQPVFPGDDYTARATTAADGGSRIEVAGVGRLALTITVTPDRDHGELPDLAPEQALPTHASPEPHTLEELAAGRLSYDEPYPGRLDLLSELAADLGAGHVPGPILLWLAAASYVVGMLIPGKDSLFAGGRFTRASSQRSGMLSAAVGTVDDRTGLVVVDGKLDDGDASAEMALNTFFRAGVPVPTRSTIAEYLPPSDALSGRNILIVGSSRGLGAALCGAFVSQGARVWAGFARSSDDAERLRAEFGADHIELLQFDAESADEVTRTFEALRARAQAFDGVVLCAAPPLFDAGLEPGSARAGLRFLDSSLAMALIPLSASLPMLAEDGWIVFMSSAALDDPPEAWPHYVVAKAALEGAASYCASLGRARVVVARAPKMWTESTNTPLGRIGAVPTEQVAAGIVRRIMREDRSTEPLVVTADELAAPRPEGADD
jgi:NAD(P)-dependent dehydrogenase (short-subunit alcohol dehydrogenase family)/acyl dehydratase